MSLPFGRERPLRSIIIAVAVVCVAVLVWTLAPWDHGPADDHERVGDGGGAAVSPAQRRELDRLATLGYIAGSAPVPDRVGVVVHDRARSFDGYTLFSFARGRPEAVLIDMDGQVVHSWVVPDVDNLARVHLLPGGDLLALTNEPYTLVRLDQSSNVRWRYDDWPHHDFRVLPDGRIVVLIRSVTTRENIGSGAHLIDDHIVLLDADGRELKRASLLESFESSSQWGTWLLGERVSELPDIFHTNSIEIVAVEPELRVLLSVRSIDALVVLNVDRGVVERVLTGEWHRQHEARFVGRSILLFDNLGLKDRSRVIEVDPMDGDILWSYEADGFYSKGAGSQQRLANGNTLITESDGGRLLEVTRTGDIVWEYVNPHTVGHTDRVVLGITRAERIPETASLEWASR